jgi:hypothetical protein
MDLQCIRSFSQNKEGNEDEEDRADYFATSTHRVSRMTVIFIWPGY